MLKTATHGSSFTLQVEKILKKHLPRLQEAVELRLQIAKMIGYSSHAESMFDGRMANSVDEVLDVINDLESRLAPRVDAEMARLIAAKKADMGELGQEYNGFFEWDYLYYAFMDSGDENTSFESEVKEYFPVIEVVCRIIDIFERLFGLIVTPVKEPNVWHPSVDMFKVWEADESEFVGYLYLDLYARDGKSELITSINIRSGYEKADGTREYPAGAIIGNFALPTEVKPVLLSFEMLSRVIASFGNAFERLCTRVKWVDIVFSDMELRETPSQTMVHWITEPSSLCQLGSHYITGEPIPERLIKAMLAREIEFNPGYHLVSNVLAIHDVLIHSATDMSVDVGKIYAELCSKVPFMSNGDTGVFTIISHRHLMDGYDMSMYTYLWSDIFGDDMFYSRFMKGGIYNRKTWIDFRREIIQPGGSQSGFEKLERFLGRKPNSNAYFDHIVAEWRWAIAARTNKTK